MKDTIDGIDEKGWEKAMAGGDYNIVRMYFRGRARIIKRGLTLEEAQAHCKDPETNYSTCTKAKGKRRTERRGAWFDGYEKS